MTEVGVGPPQPKNRTPPKRAYQKIRNLEHKYEATKTQLFRKTDKAQSSIEKRPIPPKDIGIMRN
jgi:hypothetical protein